MGWIEAFAVVFGLLSVWLTVKQNILCWPTGLVQVLLYIYIFFMVRLYSDLLLHCIYVVLQFYGWYCWLHGGRNARALHVTTLPFWLFSAWIAAGVASSGLLGTAMSTYTDADLPYADAFTTVLSLVATWLMANKKIESWYVWIVVDVVAVGIYLYKQLYMTSGLYLLFLLLCIHGLYEWRRSLPALSMQTPLLNGAETE